MGNVFSRPKVEAAPAAPETTPLPIRDDDAARREKRKVWADAASRTGDASTRMSRVGDADVAQTRTGSVTPSSILGS